MTASLFATLDASFSRQLPTYDGTKSYQNLLVGAYGMQYTGQTDVATNAYIDTSLQDDPISLLRGGDYDFRSGEDTSRRSYGYYWNTNLTRLGFAVHYLHTHYNINNGFGFSIRCLVC